jgi:uncharacterized protein YbjT (DUF2867 family)
MDMRIAIVGGKGTLGGYVTAELARRGHDVRVLSRSGEYRVDLSTGEGLPAALTDCDAVVDASNASSPKRARQVLVEGSRRLLAAEAEAGVAHHVCISIVGCDQVPVGYYQVKVDQERVVEQAATAGWSIVQATQFHELAASALAAAARFRVLPVPGMKLQTVAAAEVAGAVADVTEGAPARGRIRVAGPRIMMAAEVARTWRAVTGRRALLVPVPVPGRLGRALRGGGLTTSQPDICGTISFGDWLASQARNGGAGSAGQGSAGQGSAGQGSAGPGSAGQGSADPGSASSGPGGKVSGRPSGHDIRHDR